MGDCNKELLDLPALGERGVQAIVHGYSDDKLLRLHAEAMRDEFHTQWNTLLVNEVFRRKLRWWEYKLTDQGKGTET